MIDEAWVVRQRLLTAPERLERQRRLAVGEMRVGEPDVRGGIDRQLPQRLFVLRRRLAPALEPDERTRRVVMRLEAVDAASEQAVEAVEAGGEALFAQVDQAFAHQRIERLVVLDLVLRIGAGRARSPTHLPR